MDLYPSAFVNTRESITSPTDLWIKQETEKIALRSARGPGPENCHSQPNSVRNSSTSNSSSNSNSNSLSINTISSSTIQNNNSSVGENLNYSQYQANPNPQPNNQQCSLASEAYLKHICGAQDLKSVTEITLEVDGDEETYALQSKIGQLLPNLESLKLSGSWGIESIRFLGCRFQNVKYLWLCRSGVKELEGISSLPNLEELYLSFNEIKELIPLQFHTTLQILDLESNQISDMQEVKNLVYCPRLVELTVEDNPICKSNPNALWEIRCALPQLEILDCQPLKYITEDTDTPAIEQDIIQLTARGRNDNVSDDTNSDNDSQYYKNTEADSRCTTDVTFFNNNNLNINDKTSQSQQNLKDSKSNPNSPTKPSASELFREEREKSQLQPTETPDDEREVVSQSVKATRQNFWKRKIPLAQQVQQQQAQYGSLQLANAPSTSAGLQMVPQPPPPTSAPKRPHTMMNSVYSAMGPLSNLSALTSISDDYHSSNMNDRNCNAESELTQLGDESLAGANPLRAIRRKRRQQYGGNSGSGSGANTSGLHDMLKKFQRYLDGRPIGNYGSNFNSVGISNFNSSQQGSISNYRPQTADASAHVSRLVFQNQMVPTISEKTSELNTTTNTLSLQSQNTGRTDNSNASNGSVSTPTSTSQTQQFQLASTVHTKVPGLPQRGTRPKTMQNLNSNNNYISPTKSEGNNSERSNHDDSTPPKTSSLYSLTEEDQISPSTAAKHRLRTRGSMSQNENSPMTNNNSSQQQQLSLMSQSLANFKSNGTVRHQPGNSLSITAIKKNLNTANNLNSMNSNSKNIKSKDVNDSKTSLLQKLTLKKSSQEREEQIRRAAGIWAPGTKAEKFLGEDKDDQDQNDNDKDDINNDESDTSNSNSLNFNNIVSCNNSYSIAESMDIDNSITPPTTAASSVKPTSKSFFKASETDSAPFVGTMKKNHLKPIELEQQQQQLDINDMNDIKDNLDKLHIIG